MEALRTHSQVCVAPPDAIGRAHPQKKKETP
jgi:hypothetical protein